MKKLVIVIPAYNEEKRIGATLEAYSSFFKKLKKEKKLDYEILVVINNTKDKTEEVVKKLKKKIKEIIYLNLIKGGKGYATTEGFKDALKRNNDFIGFVDADTSTSPEEYAKLVFNMKNYDGIIASRYVKRAVVYPKQTLKRIIISRLGNFLIRSLFLMSYKDTQCGAKIFKREAIIKILPKLGLTQWGFDVDVLYQLKKQGFRVKEFPTVWSDKALSKLDLKKISFQVLFAVLQLRVKNSPFKSILRPFKPVIIWLWKRLSRSKNP